MEFSVIPITELAWPFGHQSKPCFYVQDGTYKRQEDVDPFPAYAHEAWLVTDITRRLNAVMPLDGKTDIYLPAWEVPERTNGHASQQHWYNNENDGRFGAYIVLSGKRIPPHPAMTRYLVSHEYGHVVEFWVEQEHKVKNLRTAYVNDLRGYVSDHAFYGGRTWHRSAGEIFANDFRIACVGLEQEFWPHEGFAEPGELPTVKEFWTKARVSWDEALAMLPSLEKEEDENGNKG